MKLTNKVIRIVARIKYYQDKIKETEKELSDLVSKKVRVEKAGYRKNMKLARAVKRNWARLSVAKRQAWVDAIRDGHARRQAREKVTA